MVNDVSGLCDSGVADACAEHGARLVITHTRVAPKVKAFPNYDDVVADVIELLRERAAVARERGVGEERLIFDPGIDLAKTPGRVDRAAAPAARAGRAGRAAAGGGVAQGLRGGAHRPSAARRADAGTLAALGAAVDGGRGHPARARRGRGACDYLRVRAALRDGAAPAGLELAAGLRREAV